MCIENDDNSLTSNIKKHTKEEEKEKCNNIPMVNVEMSTNTVQEEFGFGYFKEIESRTGKSTGIKKEKETIEFKRKTCESKQRKKNKGVWLLERVHQY